MKLRWPRWDPVSDQMRAELRKSALVDEALRHMAAVDELVQFGLVRRADAEPRYRYWNQQIVNVQGQGVLP
jgi:hypothetical protein